MTANEGASAPNQPPPALRFSTACRRSSRHGFDGGGSSSGAFAHISKKFIIALAAIAAVVLAVGIPNFIRARSTSAAQPCVNNLRIIDSAKQQWALERARTTNHVPTWDDVHPYFPDRWSNSIPVCPDEGTYTLGQFGEPPTCSLGDKKAGHKLP